MFPAVTKIVHLKGSAVKVHLCSTGGVSVKSRFRVARWKEFPAMLDFLLDRNFTKWMPIWVMVIEHPAGIFVIDTGEIAAVNTPAYFNASGIFTRWFNKTQFRFRVMREEEIDRQLLRLDISPEKIHKVILSHLHLDHTDGLCHFPTAQILVSKAEWERPYGDLPDLYPKWFKPGLLELNDSFDVFSKARFLTPSGDLLLVETAGHTHHHCSVILLADEGYIFFGADCCYSQEDLLNNNYAGSMANAELAAQTFKTILQFAYRNKVIFLPSHDGAAGVRLKSLDPLPGQK